jgi:hypothetical protein
MHNSHKYQHQQHHATTSSGRRVGGGAGSSAKIPTGSSGGGSSSGRRTIRHNHDNDGGEGEHRIYFLSALASTPVPFSLLTGVQVFTVAANGKTQPAILTLSVDRFTAYIRRGHHSGGGGGRSLPRTDSASSGSGIFAIFKDNNKMDERAIDIGEMDRIQRGQSTQKFEFAKKHVMNSSNSAATAKNIEVALKKADLTRNASASSNSSTTSATTFAIQQLDPALSFSIVFRGAHTLDFMAKTGHERDEICGTLDQILRAYQQGKSRVSTDVLLLRYVWLDVDRAKTGYINAQQFSRVLQAINFNMKQKDVTAAYEKFARILELDRSKRRRGLTFEQSATFLHKVRGERACFLFVSFCGRPQNHSAKLTWMQADVSLILARLLLFTSRSNAIAGW